MRSVTEIADLLARHAPRDGVHATALSRVTLIRSATVTTPMPTVYEPAFCLVAQGAKEGRLGGRRFDYGPGRFLLGAVDLPLIGAVTEASADAPYLCLCLTLDMAALADMLAEPSLAPQAADPASLGLVVGEAGPSLTDAAYRLLSLLDAAEDAAALGPLIERELLWRLLNGPAGPLLRHMARLGSEGGRVQRVLRWLREHFAEGVSIERLADMAGMSASGFHQHFKTVTGMSPLQYRARLRLHEARRLMIADGADAASAGFRVGYGSPSQFSREYARAFGAPPARDATRLRLPDEQAVAA